jgi:cytochrome c-type biogenesis protein
MNESFPLAMISAIWLGILTSISPCPLATNIAAISFIGRQMGNSGRILLSGFAYTLGRMIAYLALGVIVTAGLLSIPRVSNFLQDYFNLILGPLLILVGLLLLQIFRFAGTNVGSGERMERLAKKGGILGTMLIGIIFALSLCPVSAALFFGSLIPLSVRYNSSVILPSLYGIGTGLPVIVFAFLLAFGTQAVAKTFNRLTQIEKWVRRITGIVFILVGIYYSLIYIFKLPI